MLSQNSDLQHGRCHFDAATLAAWVDARLAARETVQERAT